MSASLEILTQDDGFLELLADALSADDGRIQGFLYADHHVIRDLNKPWPEQEIWRRRQGRPEDYDTVHAAMMRQIEIERLRKAIVRALATAHRPLPGQEAAAEQARLALTPEESAIYLPAERPSKCTILLRKAGLPAPKSGCVVPGCVNGGMLGCPYDRQVAASPPTATQDPDHG